MIHSLYNLTGKGYLRALSFILAIAIFILILLNSAHFAQQFGGQIPYLAMLVFYAMAILFIHGVGFEIKSSIWQALFLPLIGYIIAIPTIVRLLS